jgi:hypothetical protein
LDRRLGRRGRLLSYDLFRGRNIVDFFLETSKRLTYAFSDLRQLACTKDDQYDYEDNDELGKSHRTKHVRILLFYRELPEKPTKPRDPGLRSGKYDVNCQTSRLSRKLGDRWNTV